MKCLLLEPPKASGFSTLLWYSAIVAFLAITAAAGIGIYYRNASNEDSFSVNPSIRATEDSTVPPVRPPAEGKYIANM